MSDKATVIDLPTETRNRNRPRILCIVDGPNWIFRRHVQALECYISDEFELIVGYRGKSYQEDDYDLIYPLEFNMVNPEQILRPEKYVTGIRSFVSWADWSFLILANFLNTHFKLVHVVSRQLFDLFSPYLPSLYYVTHGVDMEHFSPTGPPSLESGHLRLGWAGNRDTFVKGFREFIQPLNEIQGVDLVYCGFADQLLTYEEMPKFYNSIDVFLCASSFEGNNNTLLEAAAMERAIITTPTGTVPEYLEDEVSALLVDRDPEQFRSAVLQLRDDPELRCLLGRNAQKTLHAKGWDWKIKAEEYRRFFNSALTADLMKPTERLIIEPTDFRHFADVLHLQYLVERDLRIGYAYRVIDLERELEAAREEICAIKESETYILTELIKSNKIIQLLIHLYRLFKKKIRNILD